MLSKKQIKFIRSLHVKKFREKEGLFIAEGEKIISELMRSRFEVHSVYHTSEWNQQEAQKDENLFLEISETELKKISSLENPNKVIAIAVLPDKKAGIENLTDELTLVLSDIRDPGNLGTIIRTADWFGIKNIICSSDSVDAFNPKVVQSSMGSLFRVNIIYGSLKEMLTDIKSKWKLPVYGAAVDGSNLLTAKINPKSVLLIGNESHGISKDLEIFIDQKISIPRATTGSAESLNVAVATSIFCYEFSKLNQ